MNHQDRIRELTRKLQALEVLREARMVSFQVKLLTDPILSPEMASLVEAGARVSLGETSLAGVSEMVSAAPETRLLTSASETRAVAGSAGVGMAAREVARGMGRAALVGAAFDGALAAVEAVHGLNEGRLTPGQAVTHVVTEAGGGAVSCAGAVGGTAAFTLLTGGTGPVALAVGMAFGCWARNRYNDLIS